jgi:hypothetical protein
MGLGGIFSSATRFLGQGSKALRKVGDTARSIKSLGGKVNKMTGGLAGAAWDASKMVPGIGTVTQGVESGLNAVEKYADMGGAALDLGKRAQKLSSGGPASMLSNMGAAKGLYGDASKLFRSARP